MTVRLGGQPDFQVAVIDRDTGDALDLFALAGAKAAAVAIVDGSGNQITSFGGGPVESSVETSTVYNGLVPLTPKFAVIAASASGTNNLVAAVTAKKIRLLAYNFIAGGAVNVKFQSDGAGTPVDKSGVKTLAASTGICSNFNPLGWLESDVGKSLDLNLTAAITVGGELTYIEV